MLAECIDELDQSDRELCHTVILPAWPEIGYPRCENIHTISSMVISGSTSGFAFRQGINGCAVSNGNCLREGGHPKYS